MFWREILEDWEGIRTDYATDNVSDNNAGAVDDGDDV